MRKIIILIRKIELGNAMYNANMQHYVRFS